MPNMYSYKSNPYYKYPHLAGKASANPYLSTVTEARPVSLGASGNYAVSSDSGMDSGLGAISGVASFLPFAAPAISLLQGLFGESPEEQARRAAEENRTRAISAINEAAARQTKEELRRAGQNRALAIEAGARARAAAGYSGSASTFSNPDVAAIEGTLSNSLGEIGVNKTNAITNVQLGIQDQPSYMFPNKLDYVTSALGAVNKYISDRELFGLNKQREDNLAAILRRFS